MGDGTKNHALVESRRLRTSSVDVDDDVVEDAIARATDAMEKVDDLINTAQSYVKQVNATVVNVQQQIETLTTGTPEQVEDGKLMLLSRIETLRNMLSGNYNFEEHSGVTV